jgi:hypothetical protein
VIELSKHVFEPLRRGEELDPLSWAQGGRFISRPCACIAKEEPRRESVRRLEHEYSLREELDPECRNLNSVFAHFGEQFRSIHPRHPQVENRKRK